MNKVNVAPMSDPRRLQDYVQHKSYCDRLTKRSEYVTCPHCNGTGDATDPKHQMKDIDGFAWAVNNCAPCAGSADHKVVKYPKCTCGLDALLAEAVAPQPEPGCTSHYHLWKGPPINDGPRGAWNPDDDQYCICGVSMWKQRGMATFTGYKTVQSKADPLVVDPPLATEKA